MVEHDAESELLPQPQHREDVVVPVGMVLNDAASLEDLDEHLKGEVAGGPAAVVAARSASVMTHSRGRSGVGART